jgi:hypothetical protein
VIIPIVAVVVISALIVASRSQDGPRLVPLPATTTMVEPQATAHEVGAAAETGELLVTVLTVEDPMASTNEFDTAGPGNRYVAVELDIENPTAQERSLSTLLSAEVIDSQGRSWRVVLSGVDRPQLDGRVAAGETRRGWLIFETAADATGLVLVVRGEVTDDGAVFLL